MIARANTRISILRGTTTDDYGDEVDTATPVRADIPASLLQLARRTYLPAEGATRVVSDATCRVTAGTDVLKSDRIKDQLTGRIYTITELNVDPGSPAHRPDIVMRLSDTA